MSYNADNYSEQGGSKDVFSGEVDFTGTMKKGGTEITASAAEINGLDISNAGAVKKYKVISVTAPGDANETDTGEALPEDAIVHNVFVNVKTAATGTTKTIDVGTDSGGSGDADGFLVGVDVSSKGVVKGTVADGGVTLGALLLTDLDGTSDVPEPYIYGTDNITFTAGSSDLDDLEADIIIEYTEVA